MPDRLNRIGLSWFCRCHPSPSCCRDPQLASSWAGLLVLKVFVRQLLKAQTGKDWLHPRNDKKKKIKRNTLDELECSFLTWDIDVDGFHPQVLCVNFALVVWLRHNRTRECHVANMTGLCAIRVSIVTVSLVKTHKEMSWIAFSDR